MDILLRRLVRAAMRRGLAGDWAWLLIAGCTFVLRRALRRPSGTVSALRVAPGEQILISVRAHDGPPARAWVRAPEAAGGATPSGA